jgi:hypothetical protein
MTGTVAAPPVGPPAVIVLARVTGIVTAAEPLNAALVPVASPEAEIVRPVVRVAADPVVLFARVALEASTIWEEALVPTMVLEAGTAAPLTCVALIVPVTCPMGRESTESVVSVEFDVAVMFAAVPVVLWFRVGTSAAAMARNDGTPLDPLGVAQKRFAAPLVKAGAAPMRAGVSTPSESWMLLTCVLEESAMWEARAESTSKADGETRDPVPVTS